MNHFQDQQQQLQQSFTDSLYQDGGEALLRGLDFQVAIDDQNAAPIWHRPMYDSSGMPTSNSPNNQFMMDPLSNVDINPYSVPPLNIPQQVTNGQLDLDPSVLELPRKRSDSGGSQMSSDRGSPYSMSYDGMPGPSYMPGPGGMALGSPADINPALLDGSMLDGLAISRDGNTSNPTNAPLMTAALFNMSSRNPSIIRQLNHTIAPRRQRSEKKPIPEEQKDDKYYERRRRNNGAAKKSRDNRKKREDEVAIRASLLQKDNSVCNAQLSLVRERQNYYQNRLRVLGLRFPQAAREFARLGPLNVNGNGSININNINIHSLGLDPTPTPNLHLHGGSGINDILNINVNGLADVDNINGRLQS